MKRGKGIEAGEVDGGGREEGRGTGVVDEKMSAKELVGRGVGVGSGRGGEGRLLLDRGAWEVVNKGSDEDCSGLPALKTGKTMPPAGAGEDIANDEISVVQVFLRSRSPDSEVLPTVGSEVLEVKLVFWEGKE